MSFKYMQTKIHIAILALVLATAMITSAVPLNAVAQFEGLTNFFTGENDSKPGNETVVEEAPTAEEEIKPEIVGNETSEVVATEVPSGNETVVNATGEEVTTGVTECPVPAEETPVVVPGNETEVPSGNETVEEMPVEETPIVETPNGTIPEEPVMGEGNETSSEEGNVTAPVEEGPVMGGNETVEETPIEVQPGNETVNEGNGTIVLPEEVPVITPGNETSEVIEVVNNQTETIENVTETAENVTSTEPEVVESIQIELTEEIGNGFLTLLQVGQLIPSVTADEVASLQTAAEALQNALSKAVSASSGISESGITQSIVQSGDSNTATNIIG
jgi:hypothetical protein